MIQCSYRIVYNTGVIVCKRTRVESLKIFSGKERQQNSRLLQYQIVTKEQCHACQIKEVDNTTTVQTNQKVTVKKTSPVEIKDGVITYQRKTFEPPPLPKGYIRKSNDPKSPDAWVFKPRLKPCKHIEYQPTGEVAACGCPKIGFYCIKYSKKIEDCVETCTKCPDYS